MGYLECAIFGMWGAGCFFGMWDVDLENALLYLLKRIIAIQNYIQK